MRDATQRCALGNIDRLRLRCDLLGTCYDYFQRFADVPWIQAWWAVFFFNAWFMVVNDDPLVWFYYNRGFTAMPFLGLLWIVNKMGGRELRPLGHG